MIDQNIDYNKLFHCNLKDSIQNNFDNIWKLFKINTLLRQSNVRKSKGESVTDVFRFLFLLVFEGLNLSGFLQSKRKSMAAKKDVYYRFMNNPHYNWEKFLALLAFKVITLMKDFVRPNTPAFFVLDDSFIGRTRSKSVELLAKCYDHVDHQFKKGFFLLTLGWTDGTSFLPVAFNLLSSKLKKNREEEARADVDYRTFGGKRRKNAILSKPEAAFKLIETAVENGIRARYVLMDTWFTTEPFITKICEYGLDVIGMVKQLKQTYLYHGKYYSLKRLEALANKGSASEILGSVIVKTARNKIPVKIVFIRNRNKKGDVLYILSTDTMLSDETIVRYYVKRWSIETFFKAEKSLFELNGEFQTRNYDAMVCHATVTFTRYIVFEWIRRTSTDPRSFGELFRYFCEEVKEAPLVEALVSLMDLVYDFIDDDSQFSQAVAEAHKQKLLDWLGSQSEYVKTLFEYLGGDSNLTAS